jgi:hypothetical protein
MLLFRDGLLWSAKPIFTEKNTKWKHEIMACVIEVQFFIYNYVISKVISPNRKPATILKI